MKQYTIFACLPFSMINRHFLILCLFILIITISVLGILPLNGKKEPMETKESDDTEEIIPKRIIQIWVNKPSYWVSNKSKMPASHTQYTEWMKEMNPDYEYLFFDGNKVDEFFKTKYPEYYDTYKRLPIFIQKLDFFRYLAIYHYGGFYFDTDVEPHMPLDDEIRKHSAVFPVDEYADSIMCVQSRMKHFCLNGQNFLLGQYAFGATEKHPFMKILVDKIRENLDKYVENSTKIVGKEEMHHYVYKTTGPDFVTDCYIKYADKDRLYILSNGTRQVFGRYATHQYNGLWK